MPKGAGSFRVFPVPPSNGAESKMTVQCEACRSKFNLDDSKIPGGGLKVRCSKCSHIFMIKKEATAKGAIAGHGSSTGSSAPSGGSSFDFSLFNTKNETTSIRDAFKDSEKTSPPVSTSAQSKGPSSESVKWGNIDLGRQVEPPRPSPSHSTSDSPAAFEFSRPADFGHFTEAQKGPSSSAASAGSYGDAKTRGRMDEPFRPPSQEVIIEDRGNSFRGMSPPRQIGGKEIISMLEDKGLTDEYVVQKVQEVCEATRFVEGHEKPDWPIRVIGIDMLCKIKGLYKSDKKDDLSNKQLQIVTGINMKDIS